MKELVKPEVIADDIETFYEAYGCDDCCDNRCCKCDDKFGSDDPVDDILF